MQARTRRTRLQKGVHPYRIVLQDVVQRLRGTKLRLEALMAGDKPDESIPWHAPKHSSTQHFLLQKP
jgi:hypothetical protein